MVQKKGEKKNLVQKKLKIKLFTKAKLSLLDPYCYTQASGTRAKFTWAKFTPGLNLHPGKTGPGKIYTRVLLPGLRMHGLRMPGKRSPHHVSLPYLIRKFQLTRLTIVTICFTVTESIIVQLLSPSN